MKADMLKNLWKTEEAQAFKGWDFAHIEDRIIDELLPWDYKAVVKQFLKPGGYFITQQVGSENNRELAISLLGEEHIQSSRKSNPRQALEPQRAGLAQTGLSILQAQEYFPTLEFLDVGALVYFAGIISWEFPGFSVDSCLESLLALENKIRSGGSIISRQHRFLLVSMKP